jgi:CheY-like chemotaxis protein
MTKLPVTAGATAGASVLVAEDHPDSRDALHALLEAVGYVVHLATDGKEAVARARDLNPDLILMDVMMPVLDGLSATRELRADPRFRLIPIIALTALDDARDRALAAGCDDCVTKPIDINIFFGKVRGWIEKGR